MPGEGSHIGMDTGPHDMLFLGSLPRGPQLSSFPIPEKPSASAVASPSSGFLMAGFSGGCGVPQPLGPGSVGKAHQAPSLYTKALSLGLL